MRILLLLLLLPNIASAQTIKVGALTLTHCIANFNGYCGSIQRPIDPTGAVPGTITIGFEYYQALNAPGQSSIIAQEGGPGYSTTGSRDGYIRLLTPLRTTRNIILIDKRGTGRSTPINCHGLQTERFPGLGPIAQCGAKLGDTAWLYSSTLAADDTAAVLAALNTGPVDYYGDSYATFFGQVFAVRHPDLVHTMVLDSAYPVIGGTPYFQTEIENGPPSLARVCARSPACALRAAAGAPGINARFDSLLAQLRANPVSGTAPGANGELLNVTANPGTLFLIFYDVGDNLIAYRDLDAAIRAYQDHKDAAPLLRLVAEAEDGNASNGPAYQFSEGLFYAVACTDYKTLFNMHAGLTARQRQYNTAIARTIAQDPGIYAPFELTDALDAPSDPEALNSCLVWPQPPAWATPGAPVPANAVFPNIPVLVLAGELDTVTSPTEAAETTALFPNAKLVIVANTGHETAVGDGGDFVPPYGGDLARCAGPIVLAFFASGGNPGDTSCAANVRPIRTVPDFALSWTSTLPAIPLAGNAASTDGLRLASAAAETVGDVIARYYLTLNGIGAGLRGGNFKLAPTALGYDFGLDKLHWANDLAVSGVITWNQYNSHIAAQITLAAPGHSGRLMITWQDKEKDALAKISGVIDGAAVEAGRVAP